MQKNGTQWQYETRRFDLANAKPFTLDYKITRPPHQPLDRIFNHRINPSSYTIEVSGVDGKYPVSNLSDLDPTTACVLRPDKNDSIFITIRFKKPTILKGMMLLNGYTKNAETYRNNSRIDSMMVMGKSFIVYAHEKKQDTTLLDCNMLFGLNYCMGNLKPDKCFSEVLPHFDWQTLTDYAVVVNLSVDPWGNTHYTEIRILITATKKGLKYEDLCVSEILLIGK
jgi:hypothetical protein